MANMTLAIPDALHKEMKNHSDIRWSEVARRAIFERIESLKIAEKIAKKSKLTKKDVEELSRKINKSATKRFLNDIDY